MNNTDGTPNAISGTNTTAKTTTMTSLTVSIAAAANFDGVLFLLQGNLELAQAEFQAGIRSLRCDDGNNVSRPPAPIDSGDRTEQQQDPPHRSVLGGTSAIAVAPANRLSPSSMVHENMTCFLTVHHLEGGLHRHQPPPDFSPNGVVDVYNGAFTLVLDDNNQDDVDAMCLAAAVMVYNSALVWHLRGLGTARHAALRKAIRLYEFVAKNLLLSSTTNKGETTVRFAHLQLAVWNNLCHLYGHFGGGPPNGSNTNSSNAQVRSSIVPSLAQRMWDVLWAFAPSHSSHLQHRAALMAVPQEDWNFLHANVYSLCSAFEDSNGRDGNGNPLLAAMA